MSSQSQNITMTDAAFNKIRDIADQDAGLDIDSSKRALVQSRIIRRMRTLSLACVESYLEILDKCDDVRERKELISLLTTNVSSFYREGHHFKHLINTSLPVLREKLKAGKDLRIWSAGCSSGQEPYTIAIELLKKLSASEINRVLILATDIDSNILQRARHATYSTNEMSRVSFEDRKRFFNSSQERYAPTEDVKTIIRFKELNLNSAWPMKRSFDVIFCRNVLIYFDDAHQRALWKRFHEILEPSGHLYLGHSERIHPIENSGFKNLGTTIYQKLN